MKWVIAVIVIAFLAGWGLRGSFGLSPTSHRVEFQGQVHVVHQSRQPGVTP